MFLIIAALYFLGIQSVAPTSCPRLRCTSRRSVDPQDVRYRCSLSSIHRQARSPSRRYNIVYSNASTSALVKGLCVSDLHLDNLRLNATRHASSPPPTLQLLLQHLSGLGLKAGEAQMVCNTEPLSDRVSVWERCKRRIPRLEVVERLALDNNVVCVVCAFGSGDSKLVYHSIAQTVSLRVVFRDPSSSPSSTRRAPSPSVILDLRLFPSASESTSGLNQVSYLTESAKNCRWKCGSLPYCLISASNLCDGIQHCPAGQDEAWCQRPVVARDASDGSESPVLGLPLVYALITLGCVLGFVFLLLCFLWAFCSRPVPPHSSRHRRRHRARVPRLPTPQPPICPSCSPCPSSRATGVLMEASGTNSSSGVFEESSICPRCGVRLWLDVKFGEESKGTLGASDTSSAISGCADDSGTVETLICSAPNPKNSQQIGNNPRCWTSFTDGRSRGSFESIICHSAAPVRHFTCHRPSSRSLRRHAHFQGLNLTMPSHQQDWFLNLPAAVRRSHDDTEPRPVHSPSAESGRLLPPPNLNPFLEEPNFRCQTVADD